MPATNNSLEPGVPGWLSESASPGSPAVCSRIRLSRNLKGTLFPGCAAKVQLEAVRKTIASVLRRSSILGRGRVFYVLDELSPQERGILRERQMISPELFRDPVESEIVINASGDTAVTINGRDHLEIQGFASGAHLKKLWRRINLLDNHLGRHLEYAFEPELGYLTASPADAGTGLRAGVMLHLPALTLSGEIPRTVNALDRMRITVQEVFGDGKGNPGDLFWLSNRDTIGRSEPELLGVLGTVTDQVIAREFHARNEIFNKDRLSLVDRISRAYGTLRHSYILRGAECMEALSMLRLGIDLGMFSTVDASAVRELTLFCLPAHLAKLTGSEEMLSPTQRAACRARTARERLSGLGGAS